MKHYEFEISLFVDGELTGKSKDEMFIHLSTCPECRDAFSNYLLLKEKSREFCIQQIGGLKNGNAGKNQFHRIYYYASAAALILAALFAGIKLQPSYNTKPYIKHDTVFVFTSKRGTLGNTPKTRASLILDKKKIPEPLSNAKFINYVFSMPSEKITDADLIKQQVRSYQ